MVSLSSALILLLERFDLVMKVGDLVRSKISGFLAIVLEVTDLHIGFVYASSEYMGDYDTCSMHLLDIISES